MTAWVGRVVKRGLSTTIEYTKELSRTLWSLQENFRTPSLAQRSHVTTDRADCPWFSPTSKASIHDYRVNYHISAFGNIDISNHGAQHDCMNRTRRHGKRPFYID